MVKTEEKKTYRTRNDIPEVTRNKVIDILNGRLSDAIDLYFHAKQAHWNVKGPSFIALHELFDDVASTIAGHADLIAERIVQLGGTAEGTVHISAKRSLLAEYPLGITTGKGHVEALATSLAAFGSQVRQAIDQTAAMQDVDTSDIFTEVSRSVDKHLWLVEAHIQADN